MIFITHKFTYVTTFAGCGGSSTGYEMAGGKCLLAVEFNKNAVQNYHINHPKTPIYYGDIHNLTEEKIKKLIPNFKKGKTVDLLDGSPPCQGFSQMGKCDPNDPRNSLYQQYIRLLEIIKPKCAVMENVKALTYQRNKPILDDIFRRLKLAGYTAKLKVLNAKNYNCATNRERAIIISVREDLNKTPTFPKPNNNIITVREAIKDIKPSHILRPTGQAKKYLPLTPKGKPISNVHPKGHGFAIYHIDLDKPSPTILKSEGGGFFVKEYGTIF